MEFDSSTDYLKAYLRAKRSVWYVVDLNANEARFTTLNPTLVPENFEGAESGILSVSAFPNALIEGINSLRSEPQSVWCRWPVEGGIWMTSDLQRICRNEVLVMCHHSLEKDNTDDEGEVNLFSLTFDVAPVGLAFFDSSGIVTRANPEFNFMVGCNEKSNISGKKFESFVFPPDIPGLAQGMNQILSGRVSVFNSEIRVERLDGERKWCRMRMARIRVKRDTRFLILVMLFDIHHQVVRDEIQSYKTDQLRSIIDHAGGGVIFADAEGRILSANNAFCTMLGYSEDQLKGFRVSDITHPDDSIEEKEQIRRVREDRRERYRLEKRYIKANGQYLWVDIHVSVIRNGDGSPKNFVGIVHDISKAKAQELELRELSRTKDRVLSIIGHDLKNPINSIIGLTDLAFDSIKRDDKQDSVDILEMIRTSVVRAHSLLVNMLDWSRSQEGHFPYSPGHLEASEVLWNASGLVSAMAHQKNINITVEADTDIFVNADEKMLRSVLINLLTNAIKYTPRGGKILAKVQMTDEYHVEFSVRDYGVGMSQEQIQNIYSVRDIEPKSGTENESGTGLGMLVVRDFIERHDSTLQIESEQGKGSVFRFVLRASKEMVSK